MLPFIISNEKASRKIKSEKNFNELLKAKGFFAKFSFYS